VRTSSSATTVFIPGRPAEAAPPSDVGLGRACSLTPLPTPGERFHSGQRAVICPCCRCLLREGVAGPAGSQVTRRVIRLTFVAASGATPGAYQRIPRPAGVGLSFFLFLFCCSTRRGFSRNYPIDPHPRTRRKTRLAGTGIEARWDTTKTSPSPSADYPRRERDRLNGFGGGWSFSTAAVRPPSASGSTRGTG